MNQENPKVYLDTTIFSYLVDKRTDIERDIERTIEWWEKERTEYRVFTSDFVVDELNRGNFPNQKQALALIKNIESLTITPNVKIITQEYIQEFLMPKDSEGDAAHLAMASLYKVDFLLTWNCKHLANIKKKRHIEIVNNKLGLFVPELITPNSLRLNEG